MSYKKKIFIILLLIALGIVLGIYYFGLSEKDKELKLYGAIDMKTVNVAFEETGRIEHIGLRRECKFVPAIKSLS